MKSRLAWPLPGGVKRNRQRQRSLNSALFRQFQVVLAENSMKYAFCPMNAVIVCYLIRS